MRHAIRSQDAVYIIAVINYETGLDAHAAPARSLSVRRLPAAHGLFIIVARSATRCERSFIVYLVRRSAVTFFVASRIAASPLEEANTHVDDRIVVCEWPYRASRVNYNNGMRP